MIELTARLTLQSCVSQLTDFFSTAIQEELTDNGIQEVRITCCEPSGEVMPFIITLYPIGAPKGSYKFTSLECTVYSGLMGNDQPPVQALFTCSIGKGKMKVSTCFKCGLHVCGDFIKFYTKER